MERTSENRIPGESIDIVVIEDQSAFDEIFDDYFIAEINKSNFPIVGFNTRWDLNMATMKQRSKNAKKNLKQANQQARYDNYNGKWNSVGFGADEFVGDNDEEAEIRSIRSIKASKGQIALLTMSTLTGVTIQIRTCCFPAFPEKLRCFLESGNYFKVGFGLRKDMYRLWEEQKCQLLSWVDLRHLLMDWKEFKRFYHFRRMGTYSVASYLFETDFQNKCAAACSDWYNTALRREQIESTAEQTQMDVDLLAMYSIKRFKLRDDVDGRLLTIYDSLPSAGVDELIKLLNEFRMVTWDKSKYNFSEMPVIRKTFDDSERKRLPPGDWCRARITGDMATNVQKLFGSQPYLGVNMNTTSTLPPHYESEFVSEDGKYVLLMEIEEIRDTLSPDFSSTNSSEKELLRKNFRRASFEKALEKVAGTSTSKVADVMQVAKKRRALRAACTLNMNRLSDDIDEHGAIDMAELNLSDDDDIDDDLSVCSNPVRPLPNPEFFARSNAERLAREARVPPPDGIISPSKALANFDDDNPQLVFPLPPPAAAPTNVRMLRPANFGTVSTSPPPELTRFVRVPIPFIDKNGRLISAASSNSRVCPSPLSPIGSLQNGTNGIGRNSILPSSIDDGKSKILLPSNISNSIHSSLINNNLPISTKPFTPLPIRVASPLPRNPTDSVVFAKGRGKMLQALQHGK